jgi:hypothetical protein
MLKFPLGVLAVVECAEYQRYGHLLYFAYDRYLAILNEGAEPL